MTAIIQSIQPFTVSITTATTAGTAAITAVNTSMAVIFPNGVRDFNAGAAGWNGAAAELVLTSSVLVTARRGVTIATTTIVAGTVVEFANFVDSIQTGTITVTTATTGATATINAVSTRAFVIYQGANVVAPASRSAAQCGVTLVDSTQVLAVSHPSSLGIAVRYAVVDLSSYLVDSVQQIDFSTNAATSIDTFTINSVELARTVLIDGGQVSTAGIAAAQLQSTLAGYQRLLAGPTSVQFIRTNSTNVVARRHFVTVVQFQAAALATTVQRGLITVTTATGVTGTATIAAVSTRGQVNVPSMTGTPTSGSAPIGIALTASLASTLVTLTRGSSLNTSLGRFEVFEWATSIAVAAGSTSVGSGLVYSNLLSGHVRSPVNRAHYIMQGSV
jgi:hypothetical protein